eukprot:s3960_g6.t1
MAVAAVAAVAEHGALLRGSERRGRSREVTARSRTRTAPAPDRAGGSQNRHKSLVQLTTMYLALFLAGLLAGEAVRVDVGQENKDGLVNESGMEKKAGVVLGRLKAFDESGLRKLAQDPTVELFLPSFIEEDATPELPAQWRSQLTIGKVLGEGSFGKVFKCQVKCDPTQYVTVKLIKDKTADVLQEIKVLEPR